MSAGGTKAAQLGTLVAWLWRLGLAVLAMWALVLMLWGLSLTKAFDTLLYFTTLTTLVVFLVNAGAVIRPVMVEGQGGRFEGSLGWFRGLATLMAVFTGVMFAALLEGGYPDLQGKISHLVLPIAMTVDWLGIGRNQTCLPLWVPLSWTVVLMPYFWVYAWDARADGQPMYAFLDPAAADWWNWVGIVAGIAFGIGVALWLLGRVRGKLLPS